MITFKQATLEIATKLGTQAFHNEMGGSMNPWVGIDAGAAASILEIIYDVADANDIETELMKIARNTKAELRRNQIKNIMKPELTDITPYFETGV